MKASAKTSALNLIGLLVLSYTTNGFIITGPSSVLNKKLGKTKTSSRSTFSSKPVKPVKNMGLNMIDPSCIVNAGDMVDPSCIQGAVSTVSNIDFQSVVNVVETVVGFAFETIKALLPFVFTYFSISFLISLLGFIGTQGMPGMPGGNQLGAPVGTIDEEQNVTLDDVAGIDYVKREVEEVIGFLTKPEKYDAIGAKIPRGVLLSSPPGCGKTLLARAISSSAGVPMISCNGAEFVSIYVGNGPKRVRELFETARKRAPCVVFIDEIDAIGGARGGGPGQGNDEREATLNQLLSEMDGVGRNDGIVVMGATNRAEGLDPALVRPGRMDRKISIGLPDAEARLEILKSHISNKKLDSDVDLTPFSKQTIGFSGADLSGLMNEAAIFAVRYGRESIKTSDIEEAFDKMTVGIRRPDAVISDETDNIVAIHEAAHAIVGALEKDYHRVSRISCIPSSSGAGGFTLFSPEEKSMSNYSMLRSELRTLLAGRAGEEYFLGKENVTTGAISDIKRAKKIARDMVDEYGLGGSISVPEKSVSSYVMEILQDTYNDALKTVEENNVLIKEVSKTLIEKREIGEEEFYGILSDYGLIL